MSKGSAPIGVFDSGVGGLTVLRALRSRLPAEDFVYLGDTARLPYGTKSPQTVRAYARQAAKRLVDAGVELLVIACNTASAVALDDLREAFAPLPVLGVVEPGADAAVQATRKGRVLVTGTDGTIAGGAYPRALRALSPDLEIWGQACPLFVALAEEGWVDGPVAEAVVRRYLDPWLRDPAESRPDVVVLGCTHFPALRPVIEGVLGPEVRVVDSASPTAEAVAAALGPTRGAAREEAAGTCRFWATDAPERFARVAPTFLGEALTPDQVELVDL